MTPIYQDLSDKSYSESAPESPVEMARRSQ